MSRKFLHYCLMVSLLSLALMIVLGIGYAILFNIGIIQSSDDSVIFRVVNVLISLSFFVSALLLWIQSWSYVKKSIAMGNKNKAYGYTAILLMLFVFGGIVVFILEKEEHRQPE